MLQIKSSNRLATLLLVGGCILSLSFACAYALDAQAKKSDSDTSAQNIGLLLSPDKTIRNSAMQKIGIQRERDSTAIVAALTTAIQRHRNDLAYDSPLASVCTSIQTLNIVEAERDLYNIADYRIDGKTIPLGLCIGTDGFYPAAAALVAIRADVYQLVNHIPQCSSDSQIRALTWVLAKRTHDLDEAKAALNKEIATGYYVTNKNLQRAFSLVSSVKSADDIFNAK